MSETTVKQKEPLIRLVHREEDNKKRDWLIRIIAVILGLLVCALFLHNITHLDPIAVYTSMFKGAFGTESRTWVTLKDMSLLLCISVGLAPAFKMKFWNIGAEGQVLIGGLVSAACMIYLGGKLPNGLLLILMAVIAMIAGALWGLIPALFKAKYRTNETLFTLMMNYIALQLVEFYVDVWDKKQSHSVGVINSSTKAGWLPSLFGQQYGLLVLIVLLLTALMYVYLKRTKQGYEIAVVGESENTARYAGISVSHVIKRTMLISGAIAGLAGFLEVAGVSHTISSATAGGRGFTAIIVAWLAKFNSLGMILITFLLAFLNRGSNQIASDFNFNKYGANIITGILLFFILGSEFFINYQIVFRKKEAVK
ncbi:MAG: ABC transporter permease [Solobacterium sp.]|jgi:simple sugar transport system permease protein|nr:ABC transporter permease [Solobacterium sp.]MCH4223165.1 ABC transporter permease [Solobacterium sp.]MCH4266693.1 ABC transporter permease [Solobacterium sp.]